MGENMEMLSHALGWANYLLTWTWLLWFGVGTVVGGIMLARDEWRLHRTRPKPEEVCAHAKNLVARYGREAFRINGDAMVAARNAKQFDRYRFLKEVSGELIRHLFGSHDEQYPPALTSDVSTPRCFPGVSPTASERREAKH